MVDRAAAAADAAADPAPVEQAAVAVLQVAAPAAEVGPQVAVVAEAVRAVVPAAAEVSAEGRAEAVLEALVAAAPVSGRAGDRATSPNRSRSPCDPRALR